MNRGDLAQRLAGHLVNEPWTEADLLRRLTRLLPDRLAKQAGALARGLIADDPGPTAPRLRDITRGLKDAPDFAPVLAHITRYNLTLPPCLTAPKMRLPEPFAGLNLPQFNTSEDLSEWLALTPLELIRFADLRGLSANSPDPFGPHYRSRLIPKSNGRTRLIEEPKPFLKRLQRRLLHGLLNQVPPHEASFGFTPGRNAPQGAARHAGEALVACFDLADFFPSVTFARVFGLFRSLGYPEAVARDLAGLCTTTTPKGEGRFTTRHLPQGAPTSPAIANLCLYRLDRRLAGLAQHLGANFSRYADDLTFSGDPHIGPVLARAVPGIVAEEGFALNPTKTRFQTAHNRQIVTGITVNAHVNLPRPAYDRLKAAIHQLPQPPDPRTAQVLAGRVAWAISLNPHRGDKLARALVAKLSPQAEQLG